MGADDVAVAELMHPKPLAAFDVEVEVMAVRELGILAFGNRGFDFFGTQ